MTFAIRVDAERWRAHQSLVLDSFSQRGISVVPVVKSDGYGLGQAPLVGEVLRQGGGRLAVGNAFEAVTAVRLFNGDVVVLEPYQPADVAAGDAWTQLDAPSHRDRVVRTIADEAALEELCSSGGGRRFVVELRTSMRRFGILAARLSGALAAARSAVERGELRFEGITAHLPISPNANDLQDLIKAVESVSVDSGLEITQLWLSHVTADQAARIAQALPGIAVTVRVGSRLWLGDRSALEAVGTVLSVEPLTAGMSAGYRGRKARRAGHLLVVSGGSAHGIGLSAPSQNSTLRQRGVAAATGLLDAVGYAKSPFNFAGRDLWFFEPPHQQLSLLFVPHGEPIPAVGELLNADVRFTTTRADVVLGLD